YGGRGTRAVAEQARESGAGIRRLPQFLAGLSVNGGHPLFVLVPHFVVQEDPSICNDRGAVAFADTLPPEDFGSVRPRRDLLHGHSVPSRPEPLRPVRGDRDLSC